MAKPIKKILSAMRKADLEYGLIQNNDKIAIGISGGKDSSLLLYLLHLYQYLAKNTFDKHFDIIGIHINLNFGEDDRPVSRCRPFPPVYDIPHFQ